MNVFRLCGDMSHLFSIIVLLLRLRVAKNAQGTSVFIFLARIDTFQELAMEQTME
jgi:hypothetical protein